MNSVHRAISKAKTVRQGATVALLPANFVDSLDLSVHDRIESIQEEWLEAEKSSSISVYQRYGWIKKFLVSGNSVSGQPFVIMGKYHGDVAFILPFAIEGKLLRRMQFIGGSHSNFNLGIFPARFAALMTPDMVSHIFRRIVKLTPGMGYIKLCCLPKGWRGTINPLLALRHQRSANPAFVLDLTGGFEATLARGNAKRKRKKFRQQCRMADALGGYEFIKAEGVETATRIIDIFFQQKSSRLKQLGIRDVFSDDWVYKFVTDLAVLSINESEPLLQLYALKVGGEIVAVFGGGVLRDRLSGYFSSIDIYNNPQLSPGEMLLYLVVEDACANGCHQIDLGAGDERYKHSWCSEKIEMYDVILPLSYTSMPIVTLRRVYGNFRRWVRDTPIIWQLYKRVRLLKAKF